MSNDIIDVLNLILKKVEGIEKTLNINSKETTATNLFDENNHRINSAVHINKLWDEVNSIIRNELSEIPYNTFIKGIKLIKIEDKTVILKVANSFTLDNIKNRYIDLILNSFKLCGCNVNNYKIILEGNTWSVIKKGVYIYDI